MDEPIQQDRIRLVLVEYQALLRASLSRFLAAQPGLEVVAECGTAGEALEVLNVSTVNVVLLDLKLRIQPGGEFILAARRAGYQGRFLIIAGELEAEDLSEMLKLGVSGIFLKSEAPDRLVQAIRLVATGAVWVEQKAMQLLADQLADRPPLDDSLANSLTEREEKVLLGILGGLTNRKIGDDIGLSESSVKAVVQQLFVRAGVRTRSQLVRAALEGSLGTAKRLIGRAGHSAGAGVPANSHHARPPAHG
jgi:DNA-binding NarL/FixJ family response regulator